MKGYISLKKHLFNDTNMFTINCNIIKFTLYKANYERKDKFNFISLTITKKAYNLNLAPQHISKLINPVYMIKIKILKYFFINDQWQKKLILNIKKESQYKFIDYDEIHNFINKKDLEKQINININDQKEYKNEIVLKINNNSLNFQIN